MRTSTVQDTVKSGRSDRACTILVVDDHEPLRRSVVTWLEFRFPCCSVSGVESAEEALALSDRPDIVLMDINLRGIDGLEAAGLMKAASPETSVVMLTMHDTPHHRRAAEKAGASAYIAKRDLEAQLEPTVGELIRERGRGRS
jgi:DNA-binding NarL/FixJ family response regulator